MNKQKSNTETRLTKTDRLVFVGGIVAITLLGIYLADVLFAGHAASLLIEVTLYIAILGMYSAVFRTPRPSRLTLVVARTDSYAGIGAAILTAAFVVYFLATFHW